MNRKINERLGGFSDNRNYAGASRDSRLATAIFDACFPEQNSAFQDNISWSESQAQKQSSEQRERLKSLISQLYM